MAWSSQVVAQVANPREQLKQYVADLQQNPTNQSLREKIIKLALELKPPPEIPEEARRHFIRGNTSLKETKGDEDYDSAIARYNDALLIAPWLGDAYYNPGKALELRQRYDAAVAALKLFLLSAPAAQDARAGQDKIYELEEKQARLRAVEEKKRREQEAEEERKRAEVIRRQQAENALQLLRGSWKIMQCRHKDLALGCNEAERQGSNWSDLCKPFSDRNECIFELTFPADGTVTFPDRWSARWAGAAMVVGIPQGPNLNNMKWECRHADGSTNTAWSRTSADGRVFKISCDRDDTSYSPNTRYYYVTWFRP